MSRLTRDGTAEPVSRDQILRHARGQGNIHFPYSADHEQDWQPNPVDPFSAICDDHTYSSSNLLSKIILSSNNPALQNEVIVYNITLWYCNFGRNCYIYTFYYALYSVFRFHTTCSICGSTRS